MSSRPVVAFLVVLLAVAPVLAGEDPAPPPDQPGGKDPPAKADPPDPPKEPEAPKVATDKEAKHELTIFERDFETEDVDFRLDALLRLSKCVHLDVVKRLQTIAAKDRDMDIRAEAVKGLRHQLPFKAQIAPKLAPLFEDDKLDPKILAQVVLTLGAFEYTRCWKDLTEVLSHDDDDVVVAAFKVLGDWKELRAWRAILEFWEIYPEEGKWSTGSVTVDTGTAGDGDQRAAKAKWMGRYGNKVKQRARPACVKAMKETVRKITGEELAQVAEFRQWCRDHEREIKQAEKRRD